MSVALAVPDAGKGERITLLTTAPDASRPAFLAAARANGASELMVPAEIVRVDALPLLGSGKVDTVAAARLLAERRAAPGRSRRARPIDGSRSARATAECDGVRRKRRRAYVFGGIFLPSRKPLRQRLISTLPNSPAFWKGSLLMNASAAARSSTSMM